MIISRHYIESASRAFQSLETDVLSNPHYNFGELTPECWPGRKARNWYEDQLSVEMAAKKWGPTQNSIECLSAARARDMMLHLLADDKGLWHESLTYICRVLCHDEMLLRSAKHLTKLYWSMSISLRLGGSWFPLLSRLHGVMPGIEYHAREEIRTHQHVADREQHGFLMRIRNDEHGIFHLAHVLESALSMECSSADYQECYTLISRIFSAYAHIAAAVPIIEEYQTQDEDSGSDLAVIVGFLAIESQSISKISGQINRAIPTDLSSIETHSNIQVQSLFANSIEFVLASEDLHVSLISEDVVRVRESMERIRTLGQFLTYLCPDRWME